jgi:hypothetical protein
MQKMASRFIWGAFLGACLAVALFSVPSEAQVSDAGTVLDGGSGTVGPYWGQGTSGTPVPQAGCDPQVQKMSDNTARYMVDNYTQMATAQYPMLPPMGFSGLSCLQQLLDSGLNMFWSPSSLSAILAAIIAETCAIAAEMVESAEQPLYDSMYASAPLGQIVPGVSLGGLFNGGFSVSPMMGNTNSGLLNITGPSNLLTGGVGTTSLGSSNLASYWGGGSQNNSQPAYGSLFGTGGGITGIPSSAQPASSGGSWLGSFGSGL